MGYSVGVRGARVGRDAGGRKYSALSIPGTGIYRRDYAAASQGGQQPSIRGAANGRRLLGFLAVVVGVLWAIFRLFS